MTADIECDYLIVGAGAAGMAFADEVLTHSDATVAIVDRRHAPGGHWVDAYPFVRLHQPSAFYGVSSTPLGHDSIDQAGLNAGFYELAGPDEICAYYDRLMSTRFVPSGRVRWFPGCEYQGGGRFVSRISGTARTVRIGRRLVDTTYLEGTIPATNPPPFEVAEDVRCIPVGELVHVGTPARHFVIVGAGKTAMDAVVWLVGNGVSPDAIRWIKPREAWWLNRKWQQPHALLPDFYTGVALQFEAMAAADSVEDLFVRLEALDLLCRVDTEVWPSMFRAAIVSESELELLRSVRDVVRLGHVRRVERTSIELDGGRVSHGEDTIVVHCAAQALSRLEPRPVFEPGRITIQPLRWGFAPFQAALTAFVDLALDEDEEKNSLCPPMRHPNTNEDFVRQFLTSMAGDVARRAYPEIHAWVNGTRLNPGSGVRSCLDDPRVQTAHAKIKHSAPRAASNLARLLDASPLSDNGQSVK
jgi:hypothetical protein